MSAQLLTTELRLLAALITHKQHLLWKEAAAIKTEERQLDGGIRLSDLRAGLGDE